MPSPLGFQNVLLVNSLQYIGFVLKYNPPKDWFLLCRRNGCRVPSIAGTLFQYMASEVCPAGKWGKSPEAVKIIPEEGRSEQREPNQGQSEGNDQPKHAPEAGFLLFDALVRSRWDV